MAATQPAVTQPATRSPFWPVLLASTALLGWLTLQMHAQWLDRETLQLAKASQQSTVDKAATLRGALDALAADTQRLADAGNANAGLLVKELRARGITINPSASAAKP